MLMMLMMLMAAESGDVMCAEGVEAS